MHIPGVLSHRGLGCVCVWMWVRRLLKAFPPTQSAILSIDWRTTKTRIEAAGWNPGRRRCFPSLIFDLFCLFIHGLILNNLSWHTCPLWVLQNAIRCWLMQYTDQVECRDIDSSACRAEGMINLAGWFNSRWLMWAVGLYTVSHFTEALERSSDTWEVRDGESEIQRAFLSFHLLFCLCSLRIIAAGSHRMKRSFDLFGYRTNCQTIVVSFV